MWKRAYRVGRRTNGWRTKLGWPQPLLHGSRESLENAMALHFILNVLVVHRTTVTHNNKYVLTLIEWEKLLSTISPSPMWLEG